MYITITKTDTELLKKVQWALACYAAAWWPLDTSRMSAGLSSCIVIRTDISYEALKDVMGDDYTLLDVSDEHPDPDMQFDGEETVIAQSPAPKTSAERLRIALYNTFQFLLTMLGFFSGALAMVWLVSLFPFPYGYVAVVGIILLLVFFFNWLEAG